MQIISKKKKRTIFKKKISLYFYFKKKKKNKRNIKKKKKKIFFSRSKKKKKKKKNKKEKKKEMSHSKIHVPDMGSHIMLDFTNIQNFDLSDHELMINILEDGLKKTDCNICDRQVAEHDKGFGYSLLFLLSESHLSVHTWPAKNTFTIDFYNVKLNCKLK
jgi:S-adenosylmethionine/arginine decarboxylase-like enzyme